MPKIDKNKQVAEKLEEMGIRAEEAENYRYFDNYGVMIEKDWFMEHQIDLQKMSNFYRRVEGDQFNQKLEKVIEYLELIKKIHFIPNQMFEFHYDKNDNLAIIVWYEKNREEKQGKEWRNKTIKVLIEAGYTDVEEEIKFKSLFNSENIDKIVNDKITEIYATIKEFEKEVEQDLYERITAIFNAAR